MLNTLAPEVQYQLHLTDTALFKLHTFIHFTLPVVCVSHTADTDAHPQEQGEATSV